jgi:hypothetical protein
MCVGGIVICVRTNWETASEEMKLEMKHQEEEDKNKTVETD